jgi:hypothetical protein
MRLLINGREAKGPGSYVIATLVILLAIAVLLFVILPIVGIAVAIAAGAGIVYLGARALGLGGGRRGRLRSDESDYTIESSRRLGDRDDESH